MGKAKAAALAQAPFGRKTARPTVTKGETYDDPTDSKPVKVIGKAKTKIERAADRFTYALKAYTAEIRKDGWWIARTPFTAAGEKCEWSGPFETIESACLAMARRLATEIADRHTRTIAARGLKSGQPLYGLKATTRLKQKGSASTL
jgi:hypothetical protein